MIQKNTKAFSIELDLDADLSHEVQSNYNKLIELISHIPKSSINKKNIEGTGGLISVADIISYQIGWGKMLIDWYTKGIQNKTPEMPGEGFTKWNYTEIAKHFYKKYHFDGGPKQQKHFKKTVLDILHIIETEHKNGHLNQIGTWSWCTLSSGKKWPLSKWITVNTVSPYKRAAKQLRNLLKTQL